MTNRSHAGTGEAEPLTTIQAYASSPLSSVLGM
jgi:hypothetical protein